MSEEMASNQKTITEKTLYGFANLIKLLPTGTVFLYQFFNPVLTNNGQCEPVNKYLSAIFIASCAFFCCFSSFTDSYRASDGSLHYGVVTSGGLWPSLDSKSDDMSKYRLRAGDFVHSGFALLVFAVLALLDSNTVKCFYPSFESAETVLIQVLPPLVGAVSGVLFMLFPNTRHGIGYPSTESSSSETSNP